MLIVIFDLRTISLANAKNFSLHPVCVCVFFFINKWIKTKGTPPIAGSTVYFSGVDMVDGTPVLDIKPYIPQYDDPTGSVEVFDGGSLSACDSVSLFAFPVCSPGCREAPDGQESDLEEVAAPHPTPLSQVESIF